MQNERLSVSDVTVERSKHYIDIIFSMSAQSRNIVVTAQRLMTSQRHLSLWGEHVRAGHLKPTLVICSRVPIHKYIRTTLLYLIFNFDGVGSLQTGL